MIAIDITLESTMGEIVTDMAVYNYCFYMEICGVLLCVGISKELKRDETIYHIIVPQRYVCNWI